MKPFSRADRVAGEIQKIISDLLQRQIKDPRLEMAAITGVDLSRDLRVARVYFITTAGREDKAVSKAAEDGFNSAMGFIRRTLAQELGIRFVPELRFHYDPSFDYGSRIDSVLKSLSEEDESDHDPVEK